MIQKRFYIPSWTHGHLLALDVYEYPVQGNWDEYLYRDISEEDYEDCYQEAVKWRDDIIEEISRVSNLNPKAFLNYRKPFDSKKENQLINTSR